MDLDLWRSFVNRNKLKSILHPFPSLGHAAIIIEMMMRCSRSSSVLPTCIISCKLSKRIYCHLHCPWRQGAEYHRICLHVSLEDQINKIWLSCCQNTHIYDHKYRLQFHMQIEGVEHLNLKCYAVWIYGLIWIAMTSNPCSSPGRNQIGHHSVRDVPRVAFRCTFAIQRWHVLRDWFDGKMIFSSIVSALCHEYVAKEQPSSRSFCVPPATFIQESVSQAVGWMCPRYYRYKNGANQSLRKECARSSRDLLSFPSNPGPRILINCMHWSSS